MIINEDERKRSIGRYIKKLREANHETQSELAKALDIDRSAVCQWENGHTKPSDRNLRALFDHFSISIEELSNGGVYDSNRIKITGNTPISQLRQEDIQKGASYLNNILGLGKEAKGE